MRTLCVDTTSDNTVVNVTDGESIYCVINREGKGTTSANIISCIDKALMQGGFKLSDVDYIGAVIGPGSFTGIRIGISVLNAFNLAKDIPLIALSAFEVLGYKQDAMCIVAARQDAFYGAKVINSNIFEQREYSMDEVINYSGKVIIRSEKNYEYSVAIGDNEYANMLAECMIDKASKGDTVPYLIPLYMKKSQAERNLKE